jgi:prepilin-type N-terminal cleavage/methylation domain-containing protein
VRNWKKWKKCKRGFSLTEALVTTVLLGIGVVGVASTFTYAGLSARKSDYMGQARTLAEENLERIRAGGYDIFTQPSGSETEQVSTHPRLTKQLSWEPYPSGSSQTDLKLVTVNINWDWAGSSGGRYRLVTLVARPEEG